MTNATNITHGNKTSSAWGFPHDFITAVTVVTATCAIFLVLGTLINLWLLVSIAKSKDLLAKLRNQIILNMCALHLTETLVVYPIQLTIFFRWLFWHQSNISYQDKCALQFFINVATYAQSCVADWAMVIIVALFLAHVLEVDPSRTLRQRTQTVGKIALHTSPWVVAIAVTVLCFHSLSNTDSYGCISLTFQPRFYFEAAYTIAPVCVCSALLVMAIVFRWRRVTSGSTSPQGIMGIQLMGRGPEIDNAFAYLLAVAVVVLCETMNLVFLYEIRFSKYRGFAFEAASITLDTSRVCLLPLVWLLLPDVRARIATWRPWRRLEHPGTGMVTTYTAGKE